MKRLLLLFVVVAAAWFGWRNWSALHHSGGDEAVIENVSGRAMDRVRLEVCGAGQPARDSIPDGGRAVIPFRVARDGAFHLRWTFRGKDVDQDWTGGEVTAGPMHQRHHLQVGPDGGVVVTSEALAPAAK